MATVAAATVVRTATRPPRWTSCAANATSSTSRSRRVRRRRRRSAAAGDERQRLRPLVPRPLQLGAVHRRRLLADRHRLAPSLRCPARRQAGDGRAVRARAPPSVRRPAPDHARLSLAVADAGDPGHVPRAGLRLPAAGDSRGGRGPLPVRGCLRSLRRARAALDPAPAPGAGRDRGAAGRVAMSSAANTITAPRPGRGIAGRVWAGVLAAWGVITVLRRRLGVETAAGLPIDTLTGYIRKASHR